MEGMSSAMSSMFGGSAARIIIDFADASTRKTVSVRQPDGKEEEQYLFSASDDVCGTVQIEVSGSKKLEHTGVKVELIGMIELLQDRSSYEFTSLVRELEAPGDLTGSKSYPFEFTGVEKQYESYDGINARLRYFIRVTIIRQYSGRIVQEETIRVHVPTTPPETNNSIKMEVRVPTRACASPCRACAAPAALGCTRQSPKEA